MPELEAPHCPNCQAPFLVGQAVMSEVLADDRGKPTLVGVVHARCVQEVDEIFKGKQGDAGPVGPQGPVGRTGREIKGEQGEPGRAGTRGPIGPEGKPGPRGEHGPRGNRGTPGEQGEPGPQGDMGLSGLPGWTGRPGPDLTPDMDKLREEMAQLRRVVGETPLTGTIVCPVCSITWDVQADLHLGSLARAVVVCDCGTELLITGRGAQMRHG